MYIRTGQYVQYCCSVYVKRVHNKINLKIFFGHPAECEDWRGCDENNVARCCMYSPQNLYVRYTRDVGLILVFVFISVSNF